ncbi:MAG: N-acetylmuramoyl-L-alanine amidase [Bacilli bacterium]
MDITLALKDELIKKGAYIYMIREDDSDLSEEDDVLKKRGDLKRRVKQIDESDALLYLSIHVNAFKKDSSQRGAEVLYTSNNPNNKLLASVLMSHFKKDLVTTRHISKTDLYLYTNTKKPGVLIECGYLTNNNERQLLIDSSYQKKIAEVIANAIVDYFSVVSKLSSKENNVLKFDNNYIYY